MTLEPYVLRFGGLVTIFPFKVNVLSPSTDLRPPCEKVSPQVAPPHGETRVPTRRVDSNIQIGTIAVGLDMNLLVSNAYSHIYIHQNNGFNTMRSMCAGVPR